MLNEIDQEEVENKKRYKKYDQRNCSMISDPMKNMQFNSNFFNRNVVSEEEEVDAVQTVAVEKKVPRDEVSAKEVPWGDFTIKEVSDIRKLVTIGAM